MADQRVADYLALLRRRADVRAGRIVGPTGIGGLWKVIRGADQAPTLAMGDGSYAPGQVVPLGSYQGSPRQAILTGALPATGGSSAYPLLPAQQETVATGPTIESADPAEISDTAVGVVVVLTGHRFKSSHAVVVVQWDPFAVDWVADPRVTVDSTVFVSETELSVTLSATPAAAGGGLPLLKFSLE